MNTHTSSAPVSRGAPGPASRRLLIALAGGGLLVGGAIGAGFYARNSDDVAAPPVVSQPAPPAPEAIRVPAASAVNHVYLVASDEQAAAVLAGISEANDILATWGETPFADSVVVVPSDVAVAEVLGAVEEANRIVADSGGAQSLVVDLR